MVRSGILPPPPIFGIASARTTAPGLGSPGSWKFITYGSFFQRSTFLFGSSSKRVIKLSRPALVNSTSAPTPVDELLDHILLSRSKIRSVYASEDQALEFEQFVHLGWIPVLHLFAIAVLFHRMIGIDADALPVNLVLRSSQHSGQLDRAI